MTTLVDAMLETARIMGITHEGTATSGTLTSLTDTSMEEPADYWNGGTLWILSGANNGSCVVVKTHNGNTVSFSAMSGTIAAGVEYALATADYPKHKLKQAVLTVLRNDEILLKDDTTTVTDDTEEYSLPSGVSNVIAVHVAQEDEEPYYWQPHYYWQENYGKLLFDPGKEPTNTGDKIRIWYLGAHGEIAESGTILSSVPINWLKWKSAEFLYRDKLTRIKQDDPTVIDLFNEAKEQAKYAAAMSDRYALRTGNPQPRLANY